MKHAHDVIPIPTWRERDLLCGEEQKKQIPLTHADQDDVSFRVKRSGARNLLLRKEQKKQIPRCHENRRSLD